MMQEILNLRGKTWSSVSDNSKWNCGIGNKITYNTEVLISNLCDFNNTYILVTDDITIIGDNGHGAAFKNCAPFNKCITKIYEITIGDAEDLYLVMPMYNLVAYSSDYSETGSLWFYFEDEATNFDVDISNVENFKSFRYKAKLLENKAADGANNVLRNQQLLHH